MNLSDHQHYMREALQLAEMSSILGEVPVGAVIVLDGEIIGRGFNRREMRNCVLEHAELNAIADAAQKLGSWRLLRASMYSTLEPCIMCAGALVHARIANLFYGAADAKFGGIESLYKIGEDSRLNHQFPAQGGLLADESANMLKQFFQRLRAARS